MKQEHSYQLNQLFLNHEMGPSSFLIIQQLTDAGYLAYFAGGCVRDALLGREFHDIDIATSATPEDVERIFLGKTIQVGKQFGVIRVQIQQQVIEVATFRKDGEYVDGRRPEEVEYSEPEFDAQRRDFTINALFYDPKEQIIIDYVNGVSDLNCKTIQAVGIAEKRFKEDFLRILRLFRFANLLEFAIEESTLNSALSLLESVKKVSLERQRDELLKLFLNINNPLRALQNFSQYQLWSLFFSEGVPEFNQSLFLDKINSEEDFLIRLLWQDKAYKFFLRRFKSSSKTISFVDSVLKFKNSEIDYFTMPDRDKAFLATKESFLVFLQKFVIVKSEQKNKIFESKSFEKESLEKEIGFMIKWIEKAVFYQKNPPKALLSGDDLKLKFSGPNLGKVLERVFKEQLVQNWEDKQSAFEWIEQNILELSK